MLRTVVLERVVPLKRREDGVYELQRNCGDSFGFEGELQNKEAEAELARYWGENAFQFGSATVFDGGSRVDNALVLLPLSGSKGDREGVAFAELNNWASLMLVSDDGVKLLRQFQELVSSLIDRRNEVQESIDWARSSNDAWVQGWPQRFREQCCAELPLITDTVARVVTGLRNERLDLLMMFHRRLVRYMNQFTAAYSAWTAT